MGPRTLTACVRWMQEGYLMEYLLRNACYNTSGQYFSLNAPPVVRRPGGAQPWVWLSV